MLIGLNLGYSQSLADFFKRIPSPPKTVDEAYKRCPRDKDSQSAPILAEIDSIAQKNGKETAANTAQTQAAAMDMANAMSSMNPTDMMKFGQFQQDDMKTMSTVTDSQKVLFDPLHAWLDSAMKQIETEKNSTIDKCPMVSYGEGGYLHDTGCVGAATRKAYSSRIEAENGYLKQVAQRWARYVDIVSAYALGKEKRIHEVLDGSTNSYIKMQFGSSLNSLWTYPEQLCDDCQNMTRDAAQYRDMR